MRHHDDATLRSLFFSHDRRQLREVQVLDPQLDSLDE